MTMMQNPPAIRLRDVGPVKLYCARSRSQVCITRHILAEIIFPFFEPVKTVAIFHTFFQSALFRQVMYCVSPLGEETSAKINFPCGD